MQFKYKLQLVFLKVLMHVKKIILLGPLQFGVYFWFLPFLVLLLSPFIAVTRKSGECDIQ